MTSLIHHVTFYLLSICAAGAVAAGYQKMEAGTPTLCKHRYALCTSALCIPHPDNPSQAICFCDVERGPSMATVPCNTIEPSTDSNGVETVYSTFSFKQFNQKKGMKCPSGTPWTWCLNKPCTVDPSNSDKALCLCDIMRTGEWMTLGGDCDLSTCETGYWSGAPLEGYQESRDFMMKALGLDRSPAKWCPAP